MSKVTITSQKDLWKGPKWALAVLLAMLGMLGPFSIDTYIPAFKAISSSLDASPIQMQQTLSAYLFGFAFMNLFHGALSDSFGRRPVILWGMIVFILSSIGCALSKTPEQLIFFRAVQGLSTGAGIVVSRAVVRDIFPPAKSQQIMSQITIFFGIAPAIAPMIGGIISEYIHWMGIFWFLAAVGIFLLVTNMKFLPESLPADKRQKFDIPNLLKGYKELLLDPRFMLLALASGVPFNAVFLYILSAPAFLGDILHLSPTDFFWFFVVVISGIMSGSWLSGKKAGKIEPKLQVKQGFIIMLIIGFVNIAANFILEPSVYWAMFPIAIFAFGWALMVPVVTLMVLDLHPARRGLASSLQAVIGSLANGIVAGTIAPLVMHSHIHLALTSFLLMIIGLVSWIFLIKKWGNEI